MLNFASSHQLFEATMRLSVIGLSLLGLNNLFLQSIAQSSVASYVASEGPIAKLGVLANIGPDGSKASGAKSGVVIASPSVRIIYLLSQPYYIC